MKVAFLFFGISNIVFQHWLQGRKCVDYRKSLGNYKEILYKYFEEEKGATIDVYLSTYKHPKNEQLLKELKPKGYRFIDYIEHHKTGRNTQVKNVLECCMESDVEYDYVLMTRFDLLFQMPFKDEMFNFDTINVVSQLEHAHRICDNFYFFPGRILPLFYKAIASLKIYKCAHEWMPALQKALKAANLPPIHFMHNEHKSTNNQLSFYKIVRTNAQRGEANTYPS